MGKYGSKRNKLCECGSGKKFKRCCLLKKEKIDKKKIIEDFNKTINNNIGVRFNIMNVITDEEYKENGIDRQIDIEKAWYYPLCNKEEINRIFNVKNTEDYLLKIRADAVLDHIRLYRVMHARMKKSENWNFSKEFKDYKYNNYIEFLPEEFQKKANEITKGFVFNNDPNGCLMKSDYGNLILISNALEYFLFYMNLFALNFKNEVPSDVRIAALMIGIRIMLNNEALDFELDPRGIIPKEIENNINDIITKQINFVIGHELSHYFLNHLDTNNIEKRALITCVDSSNEKEYKFYNCNQMQEFEADEKSLLIPKYDQYTFNEQVKSAILFFYYIDIYESAREQIYPSLNQIKTHPDGIDRIYNVYEKTKDKLIDIDDEYIENLRVNLEETKKFLQYDIAVNMDKYEFYGSIYLGQWRGKVLVDRVDY